MNDEQQEGFRGQFQDLALARGIDDPHYYDAMLKIVELVVVKRGELGSSPVTVGIAGAQGSGKSTLAELLTIVLENVAGLSVTVLSLDDFYKTQEERQEMARSVHPLFAVRGVPGTHDMVLMNEVIDDLKAGITVESPVFNKADDDRSQVSRKLRAVDIIVLEGWCWGSVPQSEIELEEPASELEKRSDVDGRWRRAVNDELASFDYQHAFDNDLMIFLAVPNMEAVYRWRLQQEQGLDGGSRVMNEAQVREFIMYYERITRAMLAEMPGRADMTLALDEAHRIVPPG
jgi:D-glycerate 3-kinase